MSDQPDHENDSQDQPVQPVIKKRFGPRRYILIGALLLVVAILGSGYWIYYEGPCGTNRVKGATIGILKIIERFSDAEKLAQSTARINLAGPIETLQSIKREASNLEIPSCMADVKQDLTWMLENTISGYLSFASQESDAKVQSYFDLAAGNSSTFSADLEAVRKCVPFCKK